MASSIVGNLIVRLAADIGSYESGVRKAAKVTDRRTREMERRVRQWEDRTRKAATAVGASVAAAATGLAYLTKTQVDAFRETDALAQAIGVQVGQLQAYQYAASRVGIGQDKMGDILKDTAEKIGDAYANGGGEALEVIENLGLSTERLIKMSPDKQILEIADAMQGMPRAAQINVLESLGDEASRLLPLLENGARGLREASADARAFGVALDEPDAQKLREASQQMTELEGVARGLAQQVAISTTPAIRELTDTLTDPAVQQGIADLTSALVTVIDKTANAVASVTGLTEYLAESAAAAVNGPAIGDLPRIEDEIDRVRGKLEQLDAGNYSVGLGQTGVAVGKGAELERKNLEDRLEKLREMRRLTLEAGAPVPASGETNTATVTAPTWKPKVDNSEAEKARDAEKAAQRAMADRYQDIMSMLDYQRQGIERAAQAERDRQAAVDQVTQSLETQTERAWRQHRERIQQIDANVQSEQEAQELRRRSWDRYVEDVSESTGRIDTFTTRAAENIQDELGDNLSQVLQGNFDGIADSWAAMVSKMAAQAAAANLNKALFGGSFGESGQIGGLLGKLGGAVGGYLGGGGGGAGVGINASTIADGSASPLSLTNLSGVTGPSIPGRATGGPTSAGGLYEVNERGEPEMLSSGGKHYLLMGGMGGDVSPVGAGQAAHAGSMRGGTSITVQIVNEGGQPIQESRREQTSGPDGQEMIRIYVKQAIDEMAGTGELDGTAPYFRRQGQIA